MATTRKPDGALEAGPRVYIRHPAPEDEAAFARLVTGLGLYNTTYWVKTVAKSSFSTNFGVTVKVFDAD